MTQLPVQRGELTDRVRRFTGLVGSYSGAVDELLSPVLVAADLNVPPYRLVGQQFYGHTTETPDASGDCHFRLTSGPGSQQVMILTDYAWELLGFTGNYSVVVTLFREAVAVGTPQPLIVPEQTPRDGSVWHYAEGNLVGQPGTATPPVGGFANIFSVTTGTQYVRLPFGPIVIEPGNTLIIQLLNCNASTVYLNLGGVFYPGGLGGEV